MNAKVTALLLGVLGGFFFLFQRTILWTVDMAQVPPLMQVNGIRLS